MHREGTETLLRELARDLAPVRPIARLRTVVVAVVGAWLLVVAVHGLLGGPLPVLDGTISWRDSAFLTVFAGLVLTAAGAVVTALAGAVPGREGAARTGRGLALIGIVLATGGGLWAVVAGGGIGSGLPLASSLRCMSRATALGLLPAAVICAFLARTFDRRPWLGAACAAAGAVSLGALAVHASCTHGGALHVLLGHSFAPFGGALLLALPLGAAVRRWSPDG
jgi:hypothetical protein